MHLHLSSFHLSLRSDREYVRISRVGREELFNTFEYGRLMKDGSRFGGNAFNRLDWRLIYGPSCVRCCKFVSLFVNFLSRILMALMEG